MQPASTLSHLGQHDEAADLRLEKLAIWRAQEPGPMVLQPRIWAAARELAAAGRHDESTALFDEGVQILRDRQPVPVVLAGAIQEFAAFQDRHDPARSRALRREMAALLEASLGDGAMQGWSSRASTRAKLGDALAMLNEIARASALHLQALAITREAQGDENRMTWQQARRALEHLRRFDPDNPARSEVEALSARDPLRDDQRR